MQKQKCKKSVTIHINWIWDVSDIHFKNKKNPPLKKRAKAMITRFSRYCAIKLFTEKDSLLVANWVKDGKLENFVTEVTDVRVSLQ